MMCRPPAPCLALAADELGLSRVLAITTPDNQASAALLGRLGFRAEGAAALEPGGESLVRYGLDLRPR